MAELGSAPQELNGHFSTTTTCRGQGQFPEPWLAVPRVHCQQVKAEIQALILQ